MADTQQTATHGKRFLYCSYPRSASHLLMRMINIHEQPGFSAHPSEGDQYFFLPQYFARLQMSNFHQTTSEFSEDHRVQMKKNYQDAADNTVEFLKESGDNNIFIKEHVQIIANPVTQSKYLYPDRPVSEDPWSVNIEGHSKVSPENPSIFPDEYLLTFLPLFTIRHPAAAVASMARAFGVIIGGTIDENTKASLRLATGLRFTRLLYDFLEPRLNKKGWPVVMDANDVIKNPKVVLKFMEMAGLDQSLMQSTWKQWDKERVEAMPKMEAYMMGTLIGSTGIIQEKAASINLEAEFEKWQEEFSPELAAVMKEHVLDTMPDYEYLYEKRLQV